MGFLFIDQRLKSVPDPDARTTNRICGTEVILRNRLLPLLVGDVATHKAETK